MIYLFCKRKQYEKLLYLMKEELEKTKGEKTKCKIRSAKGLNVSKSQFIVGWDQLPVKGDGTARRIDYVTCNPPLPIKKQVLRLTDLKY